MAKGFSAIHVQRKRGKVVVSAMGTTPRGQRYLKHLGVLKQEKFSDKDFKSGVAAAIKEMFGESPSNSQ